MDYLDEGYLKNRSYSQHQLVTLCLLVIFMFFLMAIGWAYIRMDHVETGTKMFLVLGGVIGSLVVFLPLIGFFFLKLRNTPTMLDISEKRIRMRFMWGEEIFGIEEIVCFVGSEDKTMFSGRIRGVLLKDDNRIEMFILDNDFVEDLEVLARKNKIPIEKEWTDAEFRLSKMR